MSWVSWLWHIIVFAVAWFGMTGYYAITPEFESLDLSEWWGGLVGAFSLED